MMLSYGLHKIPYYKWYIPVALNNSLLSEAITQADLTYFTSRTCWIQGHSALHNA